MHTRTDTNRLKNSTSKTRPLPAQPDSDTRFDGEAATLTPLSENDNITKNLNSMQTQPIEPAVEPLKINKEIEVPTGDLKTETLSVEERLKLMEQNLDRLNYRTQWQEQIHRNVGEDGNISHYYNIIPSIILAAFTGVAVTLAVQRIQEYIKK